MARILVVDSDPQIRKFFAISLGAGGHKVVEVAAAAEGLTLSSAKKFDLVILDLDQPEGDGQDVINALRANMSVPIIVLSARSEEGAKVEALDRGANDFVVKPFGVGEMLARIRAALRQGVRARPSVVIAGEVRIDLDRRIITRGGRQVHLTKREFDLLRVLASSPGHVLPHCRLVRLAWGTRAANEAVRLRVYINQLRQKLETVPSSPRIIVTEIGVGYRLRSDGDAR